MRSTRLIPVFILLIASLFLASCAAPTVAPTFTPEPTQTAAPTKTAAPTSTPAPTETMTPAPTSTPEPSPTPIPETNQPPAVIKTTLGDIVIDKFEFAAENVMGEKPAPGYQIFNVWFKSANDSPIDGSKFFSASNGVSIAGDDGSKTNRYMGGMVSGKLMVGFTPPTKAKKFTLYWPGNDPVEIGANQGASPAAGSSPILKSLDGDYILAETLFPETIPPKCTGSETKCYQVGADEQFVALKITKAQGQIDAITDAMNILIAMAGKSYVTAGDGTKVMFDPNAGTGLISAIGEDLYVAFRVPAGKKDFTFYWDDNTPIRLGK